ncbi:MAG: type VI secretion system membrane subunit TssM [Sterolibacteriaceae bacterium]|uniref:Type VI secretion system membrane subunit TssM n=1 Tax=Candidatus Methylophosphatis roskildensis TaxID=2899263 RepID=A0A9D7HKX6_9PROT|nr:type VI secretion system membrane subunit TssM [Candidatus Methylophosphatis roskildensis]MBK7238550.1 type VI secretion system membrane subunit TssM [Sterolibacteriaceae bacterium]
MFRRIFRFLFHPLLLVIIGLLAAALIIWFVGPLIAIADYRPLESETVRWVLIGIMVLAWLIKRAWSWFNARRANAQLVDGLVQQAAAAPPPGPTASQEEVAALKQRFEEAVAVLKKVRLSAAGKRPGFADMVSLSGRQFLYQLPWYIFIGAPGSGKTTALINSGLQFPLAEKFGTASIKGVGGTRNCDWWFTDEAVLLDTAGRYTTQESDREVDSAAWQGFLELLKKSRPRRPINGVMLTVSVSDLLQQSPQERETHAAAVRARLQELHEHLQIRFPIYVLVTKSDLLAGFMEFFGELGKDDRAQVWGTTFAYSEDIKAAPLTGFGSEFDLLEKNLLDRVMDRMQAERDPARRALIFAFPQQFATIKTLLGDFLGRVFAASKYEEAPLIRGVYFTSGTQEGSPIDRVMGTLARAFGMERKLLPPQASSGRSYFITSLLHNVVFPEQGMAGTNLRWERKRTLLRWGVYAAAALLLVGSSAAWLVSYSRNKSYVAEVEARLPEVRKQIESLPVTNNTDVAGLMPALDAVRQIATTPEIANGPPLSMGFGMFQGRKLSAAAEQAYRRLLEDVMLPRISLRVEEQLRSANANNLDFAYEALKAYLMLNDPARFDAAALKAWITFDWEHSLPRDLTIEQRQALEAHLDSMMERGAVASPVPADENLIASVRTMLSQYALASRVYGRLKRQGVGGDIQEFTVIKAAGPAAPRVFTRLSGQPLTKGVPGLFTYDGYYKAFKRESDKVANELADEEGWVLDIKDSGVTGRLTDAAGRERLTEDVRRLYLTDYAKTWDDFLNDVKLIRPGDIHQTIEVARILSAIDNPLAPFLRAASRETTLVKPEGDKDLTERATDKLAKEARRKLGYMFGTEVVATTPKPASEPIEYIVDRRFESLRRYVTSASQGQPAPVDQAIALVGELHTMLNAADSAIKSKAAPPASDVPIKVKAQAPSMPEPLRSVLQSLSETSARLASGALVANTNEAIGSQVGEFCRKAIAGRYPLDRSATRDATQDDFASLFAPGGKMDDFFQRVLSPLVDTSARPWAYRRINDVPVGGSGALIQFQRAQVIRDVFFRGGGRTAGLRLEFKPLEMDAALTQFILDVDGQLVKYSHGPQVPQSVTWPGPRGSSLVRVQIQPAGPSGVSGMTTEGPWALFRMFDKVNIDPTAQPERFIVTFSVDGRRARFEVLANSVQNPFRLRELDQFQCP